MENAIFTKSSFLPKQGNFDFNLIFYSIRKNKNEMQIFFKKAARTLRKKNL